MSHSNEPLVPGGLPVYFIANRVTEAADGATSYILETGELITIVLCYSTLFITFIAAIYAAVAGRRYRPLRAKQPTIMLVFVVGAASFSDVDPPAYVDC